MNELVKIKERACKEERAKDEGRRHTHRGTGKVKETTRYQRQQRGEPEGENKEKENEKKEDRVPGCQKNEGARTHPSPKIFFSLMSLIVEGSILDRLRFVQLST